MKRQEINLMYWSSGRKEIDWLKLLEGSHFFEEMYWFMKKMGGWSIDLMIGRKSDYEKELIVFVKRERNVPFDNVKEYWLWGGIESIDILIERE